MIEETYVLEKTGQSYTKTITSKRNLYVYQGGTNESPNRGRLCVKDFGFKGSDNWIVQFVSGKGREREFVMPWGLKLYEGAE